MTIRNRLINTRLLCGAAAIAILASSGAAYAADARYDIPPQSLDSALREFGVQSGVTILADADLTVAKQSPGFSETADPDTALSQILGGTGLAYRREGDVFVVAQQGEGGSGPQSAGAGGDVEALIVTAQKREENIQDVPIAISAFSQKSLDEQKIEGGFDLLKAIPNVTFSKNNFTSYNFSIRGIGTKAVSATTDPGVAVTFNSTTLMRNRLFEQEYFDVERVEVLRGPQGTLYGRNATAGVINVISAKPDMDEFKGWLKGEVGNYQAKRLSAMVNVPLVNDKIAVRLAGALTQREGYDYNEGTKHAVNGRDLWSARATLGFNPSDTVRAHLIWERFNEDDNRSRTGKQLCHHDAGLSQIGSEPIGDREADKYYGAAYTSQGCKPGSLYDDAAFGTPNGLAMPFVFFGALVGSPGGEIGLLSPDDDPLVGDPVITAMKRIDPYGGMMQSRDLRVITSFRDPIYRAKTDVVELNMEWDLSQSLTLASQTAYVKDKIYSFQDYNRFNTVPIFEDTSNLYTNWYFGEEPGPSPLRDLSPGGIYCDPQLGCSDSLAGFDISKSDSEQMSQEIRLTSSFDAPFNFSVGANYMRYRTLEDYYVFFNLITMISQLRGGLFFPPFNYSADITQCRIRMDNVFPPVPLGSPEAAGCIYVDPNPIESINGDGHNYFRSKNPYKLKSAAAFGEIYWEASDALRLTAGLRYTDDRKTFIPVPSQVLLSSRPITSGTVDRGYPEEAPIKQHWGEFTGRIGVDWKPDFTFTEQTMLYAFYSRGYKGGGANPPGVGFSKEPFCLFGNRYCYGGYGIITRAGDPRNKPMIQALPYPKVFEPEFVNAYEVGAKNTILGGAATLNLGAYFYDYTAYQVSQIKDRTAVNENFDAKAWGFEMESLWQLGRDFRVTANIGYQDTEIADGMTSIDLMDRTAGNPDFMVAKGFLVQPSNCVIPKVVAEHSFDVFRNHYDGTLLPDQSQAALLGFICPNNFFSEVFIADAGYRGLWDVYDRDKWLAETNGGAGIAKELGGNELPNAPHWTVSLGAQYGFDFLEGWRATVRSDAYWQSQSWARVYNAVNDKLHGWYNVNLSLWFENDDGLKIELYAKNLLDKTPITDAFLNSDDTALTTNVFVLDPRLIGLSIRKEF